MKQKAFIKSFCRQAAYKYLVACFLFYPFFLSAQTTGPSTTQSPYLVPVAPGVSTKSMLSANDSVNNYAMVGVPDGLGLYDNGDGTFTLLMNHELVSTQGVTRAHGSNGAFVSRWVVKKSDLTMLNGSDLFSTLKLWNGTSYNTYTSANPSPLTVLQRFCSGDLAPASAFYNSVTGKGTQERIYMNGEEVGEGRAMAHIVTGPNAGTSFQLPLFGRVSYENLLANGNTSNKTIIATTDDASITTGSVYFYIGVKTNAGSEIDRAGLTNGKLYGLKITGYPQERVSTTVINNPPAPGTHFDLVDLGAVQNYTGPQLDSASTAAGATHFSRPEDGAWNPSNFNDFYFTTTDQIDQVNDGIGTQVGRSRLWHLHFTDLKNPELGGTIEAALDGTEGQNMLDNLTIDNHNHIVLVEDVGNSQHNGKVWLYDINTDQFNMIAKHDPARFGDIGVPAVAPFNQDEESSGVIDAESILGPGMFLIDVQAHYTTGIPASIAEGGQLLALYVPGLCNAPNAPEKIKGDRFNICQSGNYTFYVKPVDGATSYTWTLPPGATTISTSASGDTITISVPANFTSDTLSVVANNACGSSASKTKRITASPDKPVISGPNCISANPSGLVFAVSNPDENVSYTWQVPSDATVVNGQGTSQLTVNWGSSPGYVSVTAANSCASAKAKYFVNTSCGAVAGATAKTLSSSALNMSVFPNPAKGILNVKFSAAAQEKVTMEVFDVNGKMLLKKDVMSSAGENTVSLSLNNLSKGNYILKVTSGSAVSSEQIMIER